MGVFDEVDKDKDGKISQGEMSERLNNEMMLRLEKRNRKTEPDETLQR